MDRIKRLLEDGYFPSQLPPCFVTQDLADNHAYFYAYWLNLQPPPKTGQKIPRAPSAKLETFSVARAGLLRRITSIPNPIAQTYLATHVADNWGNLLSHYRQSKLSKSKPRFLKNASRAANIPSMHALYDNKIATSAGYRFMLRTDISRFFPTIYTHSVPWALHGKAVAKKNQKPTTKYFGNLLDLSLRQCQDGQTIGLPIGPDTSHLIAEAISTAVDIELKKKLKVVPPGFRYVDDYYLFFPTLPEAEAALSAFVKALQEFELQINYEKTKICSVHEITDDYWTHQLRSFQISKSGPKQLSDINHYFELAKDLAKKNTDESVMTYALKRAASQLIKKDNWPAFEAHICHIAMAHPNTLQFFSRLISTYATYGYPINKPRLSRVINSIIEDHSQLGHHSEVVWSLWICKELNLTLSEQNIDRIADMHSSPCALLLMDLQRLGTLSKPPRTTYWKVHEKKEALYDDLWLLSYEAGLRRWGNLADGHIVTDPHFGILHAHNVHFYDDTAQSKPLFHPRAFALENHDLDDIFDRDDADEMLEYDDGDGGYEGVVVIEENDGDIL
ncbi:RNA-directed DNA polymerase [Pseudomonas citronellolis]|uniref:RNA-directed DNA polymerase n=1 Tax=Pseudomonas citronellolis TaxID=53408 RepID=UPI002112C5E2|nr:RNA-directed DNA polymerase [Pseudomonas citronellolis]UUC49149.1 RNA-directed DNA polymerase [Pseudomonas citronellolis]